MINIAEPKKNVMSSTERLYLRPEKGKDLNKVVIKEAIDFINKKFSSDDFDTQIDRDYVIFEFPEGITDSAMWIKKVNDEFIRNHPVCRGVASFHN